MLDLLVISLICNQVSTKYVFLHFYNTLDKNKNIAKFNKCLARKKCYIFATLAISENFKHTIQAMSLHI